MVNSSRVNGKRAYFTDEGLGCFNKSEFGKSDSVGLRSSLKGNGNEYDEELFVACMRRFLYTRCYNSFQFLATLKVRRSA